MIEWLGVMPERIKKWLVFVVTVHTAAPIHTTETQLKENVPHGKSGETRT